MAAALTPDAVAQMLGGNLELKPTIQCIGTHVRDGCCCSCDSAGVTYKILVGVKAMTSTTAASNQGERFRLAISDGRYWCTAMLATQLNEIVKANQIHNNTILRLDEYLSNAVQGKKYVLFCV